MKSSAPGVRINKLGASGSNSNQWAGVDLAVWATQLASLSPTITIGLLGTNDRNGSIVPGVFAGNIENMYLALRAEDSNMDLLWVAPPDNSGDAQSPMAAYTQFAFGKAISNSWAQIDLQSYFGASKDDYKFGSANPFLVSGDVHPNTAGSAIINTAVQSMLV